jgi:hypothetical protein
VPLAFRLCKALAVSVYLLSIHLHFGQDLPCPEIYDMA